MADSEMNRALEATLTALRESGCEPAFSDLARRVITETSVDEATAKAAILRLHSEGQVEITLDWLVRLSLIELQAVAA